MQRTGWTFIDRPHGVDHARRCRRTAAASKEEVPAAAEPKAPPAAPVPPPSMALPIHKAWLDSCMDQLLRDELEQLSPDEAVAALFG